MNKAILVTGSTDGIGKLAAVRLAAAGHDVYLHGRNPEKLTVAIEEVKTQTNNENVKGFVADLSDLDAVRALAKKVTMELPKIDVLINNAGVYKSPVSQNKDGLDIRLVVNYLAPCLLTNELIPLINKGNEPRIINVSSAAQSSVSYEVLQGKEQASARETYAQSKLALIMWSFYLAKKWPDITVMAVNPGSLLNTKMVREAFGKYWSSADKGADILYELATSKDYKGLSGQYFDNDRGTLGRAHADAYDEAEIAKLMDTTDKILAN